MKKNKTIFIGLCSIAMFVALPLLAQKRIAVIGSSTSAGYFPPASGYPKDSAYAWKVKKYYKDLGIIDTLFNIAQSSTDCYVGMPSSYTPPAGRNLPDPNLNITRAVNLLPKPDVIIVNYPSNSYDFLPMSEIMFCLQTIKDSANAKNIKCYITTSQPRDGFSRSERIFLSVIRDSIMNRFGAFAIDFYSDIVKISPTMDQPDDYTIKPEYSIGDAVHLNPAGHTLLKNKVLEKNIFLNLVAVKFSDLRVSARENSNYVEWNISNVADQSIFIIETSRDGFTFTTAGQLSAKTGNNAALTHYSFTHVSPSEGKVFYRIMVTDPSGKKELSNIVSVENKNNTAKVKLVASNSSLRLCFSEQPKIPVLINILSADGKLLSKKLAEPIATADYLIDISGYRPGKYILQVLVNGHRQALPFVIL